MRVERAIKARRSIRRYTNKAPKDAHIKKILEAAVWAPSGLNNQPWKFKVIKEKEKKDGLAKFTECGGIIKSAPAVILVFLDKGAGYNREKDIMAIGACIQNMLLRAFELGLGTCWLGEILNRRKEVEKYIGAGSNCELTACVTVGYPGGKAGRGRRKKIGSFLLDRFNP